MAIETVTLNLPSELYDRLKRRAKPADRTVEDELLEVVAAAVPVADDLPADLAEVISPLALLDDDALWRAARSDLPADSAAQLEALHLKRQREGLTDSEAQTLAGRVKQCERAMLVRAQAAVLLKERGHDASGLLGGR